jgi:pimeloyl-ACP methyl ester carboxylesterase
MSPAAAAACEDGTQASGAKYRICMPGPLPPWNGDLVLFAHGYVAAQEPVAIPENQLRLPDGTSIPDTVTSFGYAFATTSYSVNGLAVKEGLADLADLVTIFRAQHPTLQRVYLVGASEGGLITTLGIERYPGIYNGGIATCGPIGDFREQVNYLGDFRVVFDAFFPGLMPGTAISIPQALIDNWDTHFATSILPVISDPANAISVTQLLSVTGAAIDPNVVTTTIATISGTLWYNVFATNDATNKLGGQPFGNVDRVYSGSLDDAALNAAVQRFTADPAALNELEASYQTAGNPHIPLVTLHTTGDEIVPYWHETLYRAKVVANYRTPWHANIVAPRYGHCNFTTNEVLIALLTLLDMIQNPPTYTQRLPIVMK